MAENLQSYLRLAAAVALSCAPGLWPEAASSREDDCPAAEQVLKGVELRCGDTTVVGTLVPNSVADCSADGEKDCLTTEAFVAVEVSAIDPEHLKLGVQLGGVTGTFDHEIDADSVLACIADGQSTCAVTGTFSALKTAGLEESVLAGEIVAGVSGIAVLGDVKHCDADRELACLAVPAYPAIQGLRLDKCLAEAPP